MPPGTAGSTFPELSSTLGALPGRLNDDFQGSARFSAAASHRLRCRGEGILLARSRPVQLGARLVRCGTGAQPGKPRPRGAVDRRCRQRTRDKTLIRRTVAALEPRGELFARA